MRSDAWPAGVLALALLWSWPASARTGRPNFWLGSDDGGSWISFHYFFGPAVKWQLDLGLLVHDRTDVVRYDTQLRTQMQLAF